MALFAIYIRPQIEDELAPFLQLELPFMYLAVTHLSQVAGQSSGLLQEVHRHVDNPMSAVMKLRRHRAYYEDKPGWYVVEKVAWF